MQSNTHASPQWSRYTTDLPTPAADGSEDGVQRGKVTPRFFLVQSHQVTFTATGIAGWRDAMWPMILSVTGTSA